MASASTRAASGGAVAGGDIVLRLRPIVHASPVTGGLHVRGARSSFTVNGGPGLRRLWRALAEALAGGQPAEQLRHVAGQPGLRSALELLLAQLAEHDMLVEVPAGWGQRDEHADPPGRIARWLEAAAADPVSAWEALRAATPTVHGTGRVAAAAVRALRAAGIQATAFAAADLLAEAGVVQAGEYAVAAMAGRDVAIVTPAGRSEAVRQELARIAERAGLGATGRAPHVLAALVGGAAAHRLICAVAGLPDPGTAASSFAPAPAGVPSGLPSVLVARLDPLRAGYHPWLGPAWAEPAGEPADMAAALAAAAALGDAELGVMPPATLSDLPQLPVALARCQSAGLTVYGAGVNAGMARLAAVNGWCAHALEAGLPGRAPVAVGASRVQADGILLRRLADRRLRTRGLAGGAEAGEAEWACSAQARLWWKAITLRFAVPARMRVRRLAGGVFHAAVELGTRRLGWAVESTPSDAAAFAALTAAGTLEFEQAAGQPAAVLVPACGAQPAAAPGGGGAPPWQSGDWIWPADLAARERDFCGLLRGLLGGQAITELEAAVSPAATAPDLVRALRAVGFVAVTVRP